MKWFTSLFRSLRRDIELLEADLEKTFERAAEATAKAPEGATTTTRVEETRPDGTRVVTTTTITKRTFTSTTGAPMKPTVKYRCKRCLRIVLPNYDHVGPRCAPGASSADCSGTYAHSSIRSVYGQCPAELAHDQVEEAT